jgi:protein-S-isoprenylcysteine O-methyltransferase Ste14
MRHPVAREHHVAMAVSSVRWRPRNVPVPEAYLIGLAVGLVADGLRPWHLPWPPARYLVAAPLAIAGAGLIAAAVRAAGTVDLERPDRLVISGPYAHSRNPMYVAWALVGLATAAATRSGWVLATLPLATAWTHLDVLREERRLATAFGDGFAAYRATVPRYCGRSRR